MQNLRVVHIVESFAAGTLSFLKDLAHTISAYPNIETVIVYSNSRQEGNYDKDHKDFPNNVKFILLPMKREISVLSDIKACIKLKKIIGETKPDILHLHSSKAGALGRLACLLGNYKCKIFYSPHGFSFLRKDVPKHKKKIYWFLEKVLQRIGGGTTIACGDTEYKFAEQLGPTKLIRNGVRVDQFQFDIHAKNDRLNTIGTLGRIAAQRMPGFFNTLAIQHPKIHFVWIGDGPLKKLLTAPNITITGWIDDKTTVRNHLKNLDVYLQASAWEGLPIAVLEAMALGRPIIATDIIGNKDIVINGETGYLFNNSAEFNNAIRQLQETSERIRLGENGRKRCAEFFDSGKNMYQLVDLYRKL